MKMVRKKEGITKIVSKTTKFGDYVKSRFWDPFQGEKNIEIVDNFVIRNKSHGMFFQGVNKLALKALDDRKKY